jgi:Tetratricopeptide repeat
MRCKILLAKTSVEWSSPAWVARARARSVYSSLTASVTSEFLNACHPFYPWHCSLTTMRFWGVFWVDVSTTYLAESAFLDIASQLQIPAQTWEDGRQGLANTQHPWMLVLDNADDPRVDYQRYIPAGPSGMVMLTLRNEQCKRYATKKYIPLDGLSDIEARELLLRAADVPLDQRPKLRDDAHIVISLLRSHPLALILAGSYVSRGHCTLAQYPGVFTQHRQRLLTFELTQAQSRYRDVYSTFEASADILQSSTTESAADALQLLPVLATCGPGRLPLPLFEAGWKGAQSISPSTRDDNDDAIRLTPWHVAHLPPLMQTDANMWDSFRLIEAISLLKAFSLVSTDIHSGFLSVSMHPLTHAWARDRQEIPEQNESWVTTGCLVALSSEDDIFWGRHRRQLQPHVQALTAWEVSKMFSSEPVMKITCILMKCGRLLYDMRDDAKVFVLMQSLLLHLGLDRQTVNRRWLGVYELTASNLINYGKSKEAVSLLEQVVKIRQQTLAEDHPARLASQHVLAGAYRANGLVSKAVSLLEQVIKIHEQTLAEDHPARLTSQHALAMAYQDLGRRDTALQMMKHVVKICRQVLDEQHPTRKGSEAWLQHFERGMANMQTG